MEDDPRAILKAADAYAKAGDKALAVEGYLHAAAIYSASGFALKALALFKQVLSIHPNRIDVKLRSAESYEALGLVTDAISELEQTDALFAHLGDTAGRIDVLTRLIRLDPDNPARAKLAELTSGSPFR